MCGEINQCATVGDCVHECMCLYYVGCLCICTYIHTYECVYALYSGTHIHPTIINGLIIMWNSSKCRWIHPQSLLKHHIKVLQLVWGFIHGLVLYKQKIMQLKGKKKSMINRVWAEQSLCMCEAGTLLPKLRTRAFLFGSSSVLFSMLIGRIHVKAILLIVQ